uniref:Uncharacterized protein n=1 Tax=Rhizophora mucronata TaxID=61149 RepID=A0A2P2N2A9_RHIMU
MKVHISFQTSGLYPMQLGNFFLSVLRINTEHLYNICQGCIGYMHKLFC